MLQALAPPGRRTYIDGTFGAGGYSEAILDAAPGARVLGIDRDPAALAAGRAIVDRNQGRLTLDRGALRRSRSDRCGRGLRARRRRRARHRRLLHAARRSRARLLVPGRRAARHAHVGQRTRPPPTSSTRPRRRTSPTSCSTWARSAARAASPAPSCARRSEQPVHPHVRAGRSWPRACSGARRSPAGTRPRAPSRRCASTSTTSWASWRAASPRPSASSQPGGRLVVVTFHSLEDRHRQALPQRACGPGGAGLAPSAARPVAQGRPASASTAAPAQSAGDDELDANPRARSAKLRMAIRTEAPAWPDDSADPAFPQPLSARCFRRHVPVHIQHEVPFDAPRAAQ